MRIFLSSPHLSGHETAHVEAAFESGCIAPVGPQLDAFEARVATYLGHGLHCVALSSGSAALHLALRLNGVGDGDDVWLSSMTFGGGIFPVLYQNARPVLFDLDPAHWTMSAGLVEQELANAARHGRLPRAIVPTDLYGQGCDLERLEAAAARYGVALVVDAAESLGSRHACGRMCGSGGDAAILSFNGNKIITTSGGGMLVTRSREMAERARFLATQARDPAPHYQHTTFGYNYRLSNVCAAIGLAQMEVLESRVAARRAIYERYRAALEQPGLRFIPDPVVARSTHWLTAVTFDAETLGFDREAVRHRLLEHGIESRPLWKPMHLQPLFSDCRYVGTGVDEGLFRDGLCLPSGTNMSRDQQDEVIAHVKDLLSAR